MKHSFTTKMILIFATLLVLISSNSLVASQWKAGVARVVITPDQPTWLSGYGARNRPADGKLHELWAKALALESTDGTQLVIVTADLGSIYEELTARIRKACQQQFHLPGKSLVINVSHTHGAPEIARERLVFHALPAAEEAKLAQYIREQLEPKLIALVGRALKDLQPSQLYISLSTTDFGKSRRFPTATGIVNRRYDQGATDNDVPVMQVRGMDGKLRAIVFGYACHNTTIAKIYQYNGDFAGFAQLNLEEAHPGVTAMFVMGCGGDQAPFPRHGPMQVELSRQHGLRLSNAVQQALRGVQQEVSGPLRVAETVVTLDLEPLPALQQIEREADKGQGVPQRKAKYLLEQLSIHGRIELTQTCPIQAARLGDQLLLLFLGGETVVDYALNAKAEFEGPVVWVAGYSNDVFAYLPSRRVLLEGGYEGRTSIVHQLVPTPFATSVEQKVMAGVRLAVKQVQK